MLGVTGKRNAKRSSIPYLDSVCGLMWVGLPGSECPDWLVERGKGGVATESEIFLHTVSASCKGDSVISIDVSGVHLPETLSKKPFGCREKGTSSSGSASQKSSGDFRRAVWEVVAMTAAQVWHVRCSRPKRFQHDQWEQSLGFGAHHILSSAGSYASILPEVCGLKRVQVATLCHTCSLVTAYSNGEVA
ncbi:hypothetical protein TNCV_1162971 [Trichonephila clavipes]|nr:hypothetical protein TNCV_1162971 [Trichonephila clavipes]